jgi:hypothetical protein
VINGRKQFMSNGYDAKLYVVYANTKPGSKMIEGTSSFLIPRGTPGFTIQRCNETLGGRVLIKHQVVASRLADMATRICAVRGLLRDASRAVDERSDDADPLCSMAKLFASEEILKVCQHAVELHGGNGTMLDFGIEKLYRDATMFLHMDGTVDITRFKIVKSLFPHTAGLYAGPE